MWFGVCQSNKCSTDNSTIRRCVFVWLALPAKCQRTNEITYARHEWFTSTCWRSQFLLILYAVRPRGTTAVYDTNRARTHKNYNVKLLYRHRRQPVPSVGRTVVVKCSGDPRRRCISLTVLKINAPAAQHTRESDRLHATATTMGTDRALTRKIGCVKFSRIRCT